MKRTKKYYVEIYDTKVYVAEVEACSKEEAKIRAYAALREGRGRLKEYQDRSTATVID